MMFIPSKEHVNSIVEEHGTPLFVTDANTIRAQAKTLLEAFKNLNTKIFYAIKANYNPAIVRVLKESGIYGIDAVFPNEVRLARQLGYSPEQIIFTPSNPSDEEIHYAGKEGVLQNLGSLSELKRFCASFPGSPVSIRICPEVGAGENAKVTTGGQSSKFGLALSDLPGARALCAGAGVTIVGIHSHIGSGFYEPDVFKKSVQAVCTVAKDFSDISFLDFGGGFGVMYHPDKKPINLATFADVIKEPLAVYVADTGKAIELRVEPGKFLVSESTVLLTKITTIKEKGEQVFVGVDAGFNNLVRPVMYDAYHHIVNISKTEGTKKRVQVVGNVCETGDIFNKEIELVDPEEDDILAILVSGGYGSSMSSNYNMREYAPEVLIDREHTSLIKRRQTYEELTELFV